MKKAVKKSSTRAAVKKSTLKDLTVEARSGGVKAGAGRSSLVVAVSKIAVEWKSLA